MEKIKKEIVESFEKAENGVEILDIERKNITEKSKKKIAKKQLDKLLDNYTLEEIKKANDILLQDESPLIEDYAIYLREIITDYR